MVDQIIKEIRILDYNNYSDNSLDSTPCKINPDLNYVLSNIFFKGYTSIKPALIFSIGDNCEEDSIMPVKVHDYIY